MLLKSMSVVETGNVVKKMLPRPKRSWNLHGTASLVSLFPLPPSKSLAYTSRGALRNAWTNRGLRDKLHEKLGDSFYDLTGWRKIHPAGEHWIDRFAVRGERKRVERGGGCTDGVY